MAPPATIYKVTVNLSDIGRGVYATLTATLAQLADYRFICRGTGIEWPALDYHLSIEAMLVKKRLLKAT